MRKLSFLLPHNVDVKRPARQSPTFTLLSPFGALLLWCSENTSLTVAIPPSLLEILILDHWRVACTYLPSDCIAASRQPGSHPLCPVTCCLHSCLCLTLDCKWIFWSKHCDSSEAFGSVSQQVRRGLFTVDGPLSPLCGTAARAWTVWGWLVLCAPGQGAFQRALMDWPFTSGWWASAVAWSNPVKQGCFFLLKCVWKASPLPSWYSDYS